MQLTFLESPETGLSASVNFSAVDASMTALQPSKVPAPYPRATDAPEKQSQAEIAKKRPGGRQKCVAKIGGKRPLRAWQAGTVLEKLQVSQRTS